MMLVSMCCFFFRAHVALIGPLQLLPTWHRIAPCPSPGSSLHVFLEPGPCCPCASNLNRNGMNYSWLVGGIPTPWKIWDILWYMSQIGSSQLLSQLLGKIKKKNIFQTTSIAIWNMTSWDPKDEPGTTGTTGTSGHFLDPSAVRGHCFPPSFQPKRLGHLASYRYQKGP